MFHAASGHGTLVSAQSGHEGFCPKCGARLVMRKQTLLRVAHYTHKRHQKCEDVGRVFTWSKRNAEADVAGQLSLFTVDNTPDETTLEK